MKTWFKAEEETEAKRIAKSTDMALFIWQLVHNGWREWKHTDYDYQPAWDKIHELLDEYNIIPDDLIE